MPLYICILTISFFSLGYPVGLINLFDRKPQIIINETGIRDWTTNQDLIKWELIKDAYPVNIYNQKVISLMLDKNFIIKKRKYKWAAAFSKSVGAQEVNILLGQVKFDQILFTVFIKQMSLADGNERKILINKLAENIKN